MLWGFRFCDGIAIAAQAKTVLSLKCADRVRDDSPKGVLLIGARKKPAYPHGYAGFLWLTELDVK